MIKENPSQTAVIQTYLEIIRNDYWFVHQKAYLDSLIIRIKINWKNHHIWSVQQIKWRGLERASPTAQHEL